MAMKLFSKVRRKAPEPPVNPYAASVEPVNGFGVNVVTDTHQRITLTHLGADVHRLCIQAGNTSRAIEVSKVEMLAISALLAAFQK